MDPVEARVRILSDHARLRSLMGAVLRAAHDALRDEKHRPEVRAAVAELRAELERHLEYEETAVSPLLREADAWGPVRVATMAKDHDAQRTVLVALTEDAGEGVRTVADLADELTWFVQSLERDMREEERTLLAPEALGEASVVVDQVDA